MRTRPDNPAQMIEMRSGSRDRAWRTMLSPAALPAIVVLIAALLGHGGSGRAEDSDRFTRCAALVAYAEAAVDGTDGMRAVVHVILNRVADPHFPKDACAVVLDAGQFQPVQERPLLRRVLVDPLAYTLPAAFGGPDLVDGHRLQQAWILADDAARAGADRMDPTGGALYFVNPTLMDSAKCPWFAGLRRTATIGHHVFMANYRPDEPRGPPALDCGRLGEALVAAAPAQPASKPPDVEVAGVDPPDPLAAATANVISAPTLGPAPAGVAVAAAADPPIVAHPLAAPAGVSESPGEISQANAETIPDAHELSAALADPQGGAATELVAAPEPSEAPPLRTFLGTRRAGALLAQIEQSRFHGDAEGRIRVVREPEREAAETTVRGLYGLRTF